MASIPVFRIMRTGVIKNVPLDVSENDILNEFNSSCKIVSVKCLNIRERKNGELISIPSRTVMVRFRGQSLPRAISFLYVNFPVLPYFPRVLMCCSCFRYEHVSAECKGLVVPDAATIGTSTRRTASANKCLPYVVTVEESISLSPLSALYTYVRNKSMPTLPLRMYYISRLALGLV